MIKLGAGFKNWRLEIGINKINCVVKTLILCFSSSKISRVKKGPSGNCTRVYRFCRSTPYYLAIGPNIYSGKIKKRVWEESNPRQWIWSPLLCHLTTDPDKLFCFFMQSVFFTPFTEFFKLQSFFYCFFVFSSVIIDVMALAAL